MPICIDSNSKISNLSLVSKFFFTILSTHVMPKPFALGIIKALTIILTHLRRAQIITEGIWTQLVNSHLYLCSGKLSTVTAGGWTTEGASAARRYTWSTWSMIMWPTDFCSLTSTKSTIIGYDACSRNITLLIWRKWRQGCIQCRQQLRTRLVWECPRSRRNWYRDFGHIKPRCHSWRWADIIWR